VDPSDADLDRIESALRWRPTWWHHRGGERGSTGTSARWVVGGSAGRAFVKLGATALTATWFRREHETYLALRGPFIPTLLGFSDDGVVPVLAIEDLSDAEWPPPWTAERVDSVLECLGLVHLASPPSHLEPIQADPMGWAEIVRSPVPFLALGLCTPDWLTAAIGILESAARRAPIAGDALLHLDVRSDNLCFRGRSAVLVDWVAAVVGNPDLDVAFWLPHLEAEGGPPPEAILPDAPELAAWVAGFFCSRAGEPGIPDAPHVRPLQLMQARTALPWAARALGLPPP
jgi:Phosphotransferase enzyme family